MIYHNNLLNDITIYYTIKYQDNKLYIITIYTAIRYHYYIRYKKILNYEVSQHYTTL